MNTTAASHPPYGPELKATVIAAIRDQGVSASEASRTYGVTTKSIYRWLKEGVVNHDANLVLEVNRLKKELANAYRILGRLTAETQRSKD